MSKQWKPKNWEEVCKRNADRRKLHRRTRKQRADRMVRVLRANEAAPELRESTYGWLTLAAETMKKSKATASRDFALARRMNVQFMRLFGRAFNVDSDQIKWSRDWSHYGFRTRESVQAGHKKPVGHFPFDTRVMAKEEAFCGFTPASWHVPRQGYVGDLLSTLRSLSRFR